MKSMGGGGGYEIDSAGGYEIDIGGPMKLIGAGGL